MHQGIVIQIILIAAGVILMILAIASLARRRMAEQICVAWGVVAAVFVFAGIVLRPDGWESMFSPIGLLLLVVIGSCAFGSLFLISSRLSEVIRKNNELAMQVSLLNEEVVRLKNRISELDENQGEE